MINRIVLALVAVFTLCGSALKAQEVAVYPSYDAMRGVLDGHVMQVRPTDALTEMLPSVEFPADQLEQTALLFDEVYPQPFENVAVIATEALDDGFSRQVIAYYREQTYFFAVIVFRTDETGQVGIYRLDMNSDIGYLLRN